MDVEDYTLVFDFNRSVIKYCSCECPSVLHIQCVCVALITLFANFKVVGVACSIDWSTFKVIYLLDRIESLPCVTKNVFVVENWSLVTLVCVFCQVT